MADHDYRHRPFDPDKYVVSKADGTPVEPGAAYLVLRLDTDAAARHAAGQYAHAIAPLNPDLAQGVYAQLNATWPLYQERRNQLQVQTLARVRAGAGDPQPPAHSLLPEAFFLGRYVCGDRVADLYVKAHGDGVSEPCLIVRQGQFTVRRALTDGLRLDDHWFFAEALAEARSRAVLAGLIASEVGAALVAPPADAAPDGRALLQEAPRPCPGSVTPPSSSPPATSR